MKTIKFIATAILFLLTTSFFSERTTTSVLFCGEFRQVLYDMRNSFNSAKGEYRYSRDGKDYYKCNIAIPDAQSAEVIFNNKNNSWICSYIFFKGTNKSEAMTVYYNLVGTADYCIPMSSWTREFRTKLETGLIEESFYFKKYGSKMISVAVDVSKYTSGYYVFLDFMIL